MIHTTADDQVIVEQRVHRRGRLPRRAGPILGVLLISDPPEQSTNDLAEVLHASKSSLSPNTRLLDQMGLIERVPPPVPRQVACRFAEGGGWSSCAAPAPHGPPPRDRRAGALELLQDEEPTLRERLQEAHDMFSLIEEERGLDSVS